MEFKVLDKSFRQVAVVDDYISAIWTDRYYKYGDFELVLPPKDANASVFQIGYYIYLEQSEHLMVINSVNPKTNIEEGSRFTVTGRSLEFLLDRRIIWGLLTMSGKVQDVIKKILDTNVISPSDTARTFPNFSFSASTDSLVTAPTLETTQVTGDSVYSTISELCSAFELGFKIVLNSSNTMVFSLYAGVDRSYGQSTRPYIVFSPEYDNLKNSNYYTDDFNLRNVALVAGEGEGSSRKYYTHIQSAKTGLDRRELFVDARDISSNGENNTTLTEAQYTEALKSRGISKLAENPGESTFDGEAETLLMQQYGVDFNMGDIVQIVDSNGYTMRTRVTEYIMSVGEDGTTKHYPTFTSVA